MNPIILCQMKCPSNKSLIWSREEISRMLRDNPEFASFAMQVYRYLDKMGAGKSLSLDRYEVEKKTWIINVATLFIEEGIHWAEYCFNEDYTAILHEQVDPKLLHWLLSPPPEPASDNT